MVHPILLKTLVMVDLGNKMSHKEPQKILEKLIDVLIIVYVIPTKFELDLSSFVRLIISSF